MTENQKRGSYVVLSDTDHVYARSEAGRLFGGGKGAMAKFWHYCLELQREHSGETKPSA